MAREHSNPADPFKKKAVIRVRRADDIDECVALLAETHLKDGYPSRWPANPHAWLQLENLLTAWVAVSDNSQVGHASLCSAIGYFGAPLWSAASGLPPEQLAAVSRLFVALCARGLGLGAALLTEACAEAYARGLRPALDVLDNNRAAIALYEARGWQRVGSAPVSWASDEGEPALLHYYLGPPPPPRP